MKKLVILISTFCLCFNAWSGVGEGGGHPLESAVKHKIEQIMTDIEYMSEDAKQKLNFNYLSLGVILQLELNVLCATEEQMETIQRENKLAWVFKENSREIRIDCSANEIVQQKWEKKLNSNSYVDDIFFLHEALRAQNILDDDNYAYSSSYVAAYKKNTADQSQDIFRLMRTRNNGCNLRVKTESGQSMVELIVRGSKVNAYSFGQGLSAEAAENSFLNASSGSASQARKKILLRARENYCLN